MTKPTVIVGMSGGVDSSVSALLLKQQGFHVIGLFMKNWEETDESGVCQALYDFSDVQAVCEHIKIPYYTVNFTQEYRELVFSEFIRDLQKGFTPNPDILCNREIKFKCFLDKATELGADFLATGHYCQNISSDQGPLLVKGKDPGKDQTYFLYTLKSSTLKKVLFPVGGLHKSEVRKIAKEYGLATSEKKDSTGICFIGERKFKEFISHYLAPKTGTFQTLQGKVVGHHTGAAYYTLGQRKGLGIGGQGDAWFVVGKDITQNIVFVAQGSQHPALFSLSLIATDLSWVGEAPCSFPFACHSKIRYRQADEPCIIEKIDNGKALVSFPNPQRAVTPGQSIVFYDKEVCLGGAIIETPGENLIC